MSKRSKQRRNTSVAVREKSNPNYTVVISGPSATPVTMPRNMRAYLNEGYRNKTAFRVTGQIARSGAGIKWKHYYDKSKQREYTSSPLLDLWDRPNKEQGGAKFRENLLGYYCLTGNSYVLGINASYNPKAPFDELHCLRPDLTKVHISEQLEPDYFEFGASYPYRRYDKPQVMHSKLFAANDDVYGLSPIEVAALLIDIQKAGQKWNLNLMSNMAAPSGAWVTKEILSDPTYKGLKREIHEKFSGPRNAREPVVLHGGVSWQSMSMTPLELDFLASDDKTDRDIAGIFFNFPVFLLGLSDTTFNNQAEAKHYLYTDICFPILDMFVDDLNAWLTPRYGGWLDYDREDVETIQERIQAGKAQMSDRANLEFAGGTTTFLEAREIQGKERLPVKDFLYIKDVPVHIDDLDEYIAATTGKVISPPPPQLMLPPGNQPSTTVTEVDDNQDDTNDQNNGKSLPQIICTKVLDLSTAEEKEAYFKSVEDRRAKWEAEIAKRLQGYFKSEQKAMKAAIERSDDIDGVQGRVDHAVDTLGQSGVLKHLIVSLYQDVGTDSGSSVLRELKRNPADYSVKDTTPFDLLFSPDVLVFLLSFAAEKVTQINDHTKALLQSHLEEGVRAGESLIDIAKRVDDLYLQEIIPNRSYTIAATETHSASEYGTAMAGQAAAGTGLVLKKVWLSTSDSHTRPDHVEADGQEVDLDDSFEVGGEKLSYPGDPSGSARNIINCRCTHYFRRVNVEDVNKALRLFIQNIPRSEISREQYRELLRVKS